MQLDPAERALFLPLEVPVGKYRFTWQPGYFNHGVSELGHRLSQELAISASQQKRIGTPHRFEQRPYNSWIWHCDLLKVGVEWKPVLWAKVFRICASLKQSFKDHGRTLFENRVKEGRVALPIHVVHIEAWGCQDVINHFDLGRVHQSDVCL